MLGDAMAALWRWLRRSSLAETKPLAVPAWVIAVLSGCEECEERPYR